MTHNSYLKNKHRRQHFEQRPLQSTSSSPWTAQCRREDSIRRRTNVIFFFVFFPPFATAGSWRAVRRTPALPPSSTSLIIAGVIEIRIKRVRVEVKGHVGSGGREERGGHEWRKIQKPMSTISKRSVFLLHSTLFYSLLLLPLLQFFSRDEASKAEKYTSCLFGQKSAFVFV